MIAPLSTDAVVTAVPVPPRAWVNPFASSGVSGAVTYLVAHEVQMDRWEALGVIELEEWERVGLAIARLDWNALPGVFRLIELDGPDWFELELAADGVVVE
jgi:hypothetical protein